MCQENEATGGDLVRKVRKLFSVLLLLIYFDRCSISCTRQRMALLFLTKKMVSLLHLKKRRNINIPDFRLHELSSSFGA